MRQNTGEAFFHPVTHQLIGKNGFYEGSAHLEIENVEEIKEKTIKNKSNKIEDK